MLVPISHVFIREVEWYDLVMKKVGLVLVLCLGIVLVAGLVMGSFYFPNSFKLSPITYYLGSEAYKIPTKFNPINGSEKPGGTRIVIHVSYPSLKGQYEDPEYGQHQLTLSKTTDTSSSSSLDEQCSDMSFCGIGDAGNVSFKRDQFTYGVHYQGGTITFATKEELKKFEDSIINLFSSFAQASSNSVH
ncbi:MAG: hypothetical protein JWO84_651 [Parcubacteria group bacterium]|nr:hypothetical protein [Parcubacteria group bacterium]